MDKLTFATRRQLQTIHSLGSDRNATKVLNQMSDLLNKRMHEGRYVYYINQAGRELIGADMEVKWSLMVDHHLLRNDMYIYFKYPSDWRIEERITFRFNQGLTYKETSITPDATFTLQQIFHFLEVDRTQSMIENKKKIKQYQLLSPIIEKQFKHRPKIVFYTTTKHRASILKKCCSDAGVECVVYTTDDIR
ncbi:replication-relaxation family protein [Cytobacillus kochii]|uniref:replication-relaxation family protein n=1 Tax=Cytobacillus kochii TaxID=859143 RepID=UPI0021E55888|nr:replication-relaxation family protein [Cytobacillus kochii]